MLVGLEVAHWFDSASWLVVRMVSQQVQPLLMVVTTRPLDGAPPVEYVQLKNDPAAVYFKLSALSHGSTLALTCQRLGVASLPQPVVAAVVLFAALAHGLRLYLWKPWRTLGTPLVWILHAAYGWIVVHLLLSGLVAMDLLAGSYAIHALTVGAIGGLVWILSAEKAAPKDIQAESDE